MDITNDQILKFIKSKGMDGVSAKDICEHFKIDRGDKIETGQLGAALSIIKRGEKLLG